MNKSRYGEGQRWMSGVERERGRSRVGQETIKATAVKTTNNSIP